MQAGACLETPSLNRRVQWKLGSPLLSGLWKDKFSLAKGTVSRCRHGRLFFLFPHKEGLGGGEKREQEREGN